MAGYVSQNLKPFDPLFVDPSVIELVVNGNGHCFAERQGFATMVREHDYDIDPAAALDLANNAANASETKLTATSPLLSTTIEHDGMMLRVQTVIPPASSAGTVLSFRVFRPALSGRPKTFAFLRGDVMVSQDEERLQALRGIQDLASKSSVDAFLKEVLKLELNVVIAGGTSTGKTELGRRMLWLIEDHERIVTIEDSSELRPRQPNVVSLIAERSEKSPRSADKLLQATLRLRPDRIIVGELRGSEASTFLEAINTGHGGSFTTLHAQTARKSMDRLALMVMATGTQLQYAEVMRYLRSTIDIVIQAGRIGNDRGIVEVYVPPLDLDDGRAKLS
jgi:type IV secretion system protein VirB11